MNTVLITGANKGIGFETARQMAQLGYFVYLGSRDKARGLDAVKELNEQGLSNVELIEIDVTDIDSIKSARLELENNIDALDVLINNAGISGGHSQNMSTVDIENLRRVFETNFFGAVQTTQQFINLLKKSMSPVIVNVSSGLGSLSIHSNSQNSNYKIYDTYSCSKTALNAFTVMLSNELKVVNLPGGGQGFKINSVSPGYTATDLNNFKGTQTVAQGARPIVKYATLDNNGPTGKFFYQEDGEIPW